LLLPDSEEPEEPSPLLPPLSLGRPLEDDEEDVAPGMPGRPLLPSLPGMPPGMPVEEPPGIPPEDPPGEPPGEPPDEPPGIPPGMPPPPDSPGMPPPPGLGMPPPVEAQPDKSAAVAARETRIGVRMPNLLEVSSSGCRPELRRFP
jgi:hypothetical protein